MTEGVIVYRVTDYQKAVELGGEAYYRRYGKPPTYVALPSCVDPATLKLWTLQLSNHKASTGTVQLLGKDVNGRAVCRECGFPVTDPTMERCPACQYTGFEEAA